MPLNAKKAVVDDPIVRISTDGHRLPQDTNVTFRELALLPLGGVMLLAGLSLAPAISALFDLWVNINSYDYCFLIAAICLVWFYVRLRRTPASVLRPDIRLVPVLIAGSFLQYVLWQGHSELGAQMLVPPILWLAVATVAGWPVGKRLLSPIGYFYFAVPVWDQLLPVLQQVTIFGARISMQAAAIPVTVTGNLVSIKEGTFEVLYACSGLRYLIVALSLVTLKAVLDRIPLRRTLGLLMVTVVLAVLANWLRIFIVMYAGHVTGMRHYFVTNNHKFLGEVVFAGLLLVIFGVTQRLQLGLSASTVPDTFDDERKSPSGIFGLKASVTVVGALMAVFVGITARASQAIGDLYTPQLQPLPVAVKQWQGPLPSKSTWQPAYIGASDARHVAYASDRGRIEVYANVYGMQSQGSELVFYTNSVYAPGSWQLVDVGIWNALQASLGVRPLITEQLTKSGERWLIGQLYIVGGYRTATGLIAQMMYGLSTITRAAPAGLLALAVDCADDCVAERKLLEDFWQEMGGSLVTSIPQTMSEPEGGMRTEISTLVESTHFVLNGGT